MCELDFTFRGTDRGQKQLRFRVAYMSHGDSEILLDLQFACTAAVIVYWNTAKRFIFLARSEMTRKARERRCHLPLHWPKGLSNGN